MRRANYESLSSSYAARGRVEIIRPLTNIPTTPTIATPATHAASLVAPFSAKNAANAVKIATLERRAGNANRHCERSAAIQRRERLDCRASLAMTDSAD